MIVNSDIEPDVLERLLHESIGSIELDEAKLIDASDRLATANTCYRSCVHSLCLCVG